jgi:hypothetical protein
MTMGIREARRTLSKELAIRSIFRMTAETGLAGVTARAATESGWTGPGGTTTNESIAARPGGRCMRERDVFTRVQVQSDVRDGAKPS